jgi:dTDP-glucose 4,6-dehydratase
LAGDFATFAPVKILVTGGAGFIGANFLNLSVGRFGHHRFLNVDALTYAANPASLAAVERAANYALERIDIADHAAIDALCAQYRPDLVVHFAAESHVDRSILGPREFLRTNVDGTLNLLEGVRRHCGGGAVFHHVSTDEVYGSADDGCAFREDTRYDPSSPYSASKAASDHLVRAWARTYGLRVKITNCSNNYGPYQFPEKLVPLMILNALERKPLPVYGDGGNVRDWLYVEDHCEAIWAVIEKGRVGETYNVGGGDRLRNVDVVRSICRIVAQETNAAADELLGLITFVADRPGHDRRYAVDSTKIRNECGWAPRHSFEAGLRDTVGWYMRNDEWIEQVRSGDYLKWLDANYAGRAPHRPQ